MNEKIEIPTLDAVEKAIHYFENEVDWKTIRISSLQNSPIRPLLMFMPVFGPSPKIKYLYRTRSYTTFGRNESHNKVKAFSYPPKSKIKWLGRANLKNQPMFYCSLKLPVSIVETAPFDPVVYVGRWKVNQGEIPNLFHIIETTAFKNKDDFRSNLIKKTFRGIDSEKVKALTQISTLLENQFLKQVKHNYEYKYSAFMANRLLSPMKQINGIAYPSSFVRKFVNFALKPEYVDKHLSLEKVFMITHLFRNENVSRMLLSVGTPSGKYINWEKPNKEIAEEFNEIDHSPFYIHKQRGNGSS